MFEFISRKLSRFHRTPAVRADGGSRQEGGGLTLANLTLANGGGGGLGSEEQWRVGWSGAEGGVEDEERCG